jgi:hypothetical protein
MFTVTTFIEIQIVGIFLLLGISPVIILLSPSLRSKGSFSANLDRIADKSLKAVFLAIFAFSLGIAANGFFSDNLGALGLYPGKNYQVEFSEWAARSKSNVDSLELARYILMERSDVMQSRFERHVIFIRISRGAAMSSLLFLITMAIYQLLCWRKPSMFKPRYTTAHFLITLVLFALFFNAYWRETNRYWRDAYVFYTELPAHSR